MNKTEQTTKFKLYVMLTQHDDDSAEFTISVDDEDHKFSVSKSPQSSNALLSYEETQSWRGEIRVKSPREEVWERLMQSDEMTEYLDSHDLDAVRREHERA